MPLNIIRIYLSMSEDESSRPSKVGISKHFNVLFTRK